MRSVRRTSFVACTRVALLLLVTVAAAACSPSPPIVCGGHVRPENATPDQLRLVNIAKEKAIELCGVGGEKCDFSVYDTKVGPTVKAVHMRAHDGKCVSYFGGDMYFAFDGEGGAPRVIHGL